MTSQDFGGALRVARSAKNMTQADVGNALGVSTQTINRWELGKAHPRTRSLAAQVADMFDLWDHMNIERGDMGDQPAPRQILGGDSPCSDDECHDEILARLEDMETKLNLLVRESLRKR